MSDNSVHISDSSFDQDVLQAEGPVLVDFWAEWCGPCKMIAPVLVELADEYGEKLKVCKMDVDANPDTAPKYGIRGIDSMACFSLLPSTIKTGKIRSSALKHVSRIKRRLKLSLRILRIRLTGNSRLKSKFDTWDSLKQ